MAEETSFDAETGIDLLKRGREHESGSFQYFLYKERIKYLIEIRGESFDTVMGRQNRNLRELDESIRQYYAGHSLQ